MNYLNCNIKRDIEGVNGTSKVIYSFPFFALDYAQPTMIEFAEMIHIYNTDELIQIDFLSDHNSTIIGNLNLVMQAMETSMLGSVE